MRKRRGFVSVRGAASLCKPADTVASTRPAVIPAKNRGRSRATAWPAFAAFALLATCCAAPAPRTITFRELESAPSAPLERISRGYASDPAALRRLCTPLGPRLGYVHVRSKPQWERLAAAVPSLGSCPDLRHGTLVALVAWNGAAIDDHFPIHIESIRLVQGGGLVTARFHGGTYHPDGTVCVATALAPGLATILAFDVNGVCFFPD